MDEATPGGSSEVFRREGWKLKLPDTPLVLEDANLLQYRYRAELPMLALALVAIAILITGFLYREPEIVVGIFGIYFSMLFTAAQAKTYYRMQGAEVTPTQFPEIFAVAEDLRRRFQAPPTRIFVLRKMSFRADALGLVAPYVIVLPAVLIDGLEVDELRYVLGQALGHICFGHTRIAVLMGGEESALPALLSWVAWLRDMIFAGYWRAATTSGDRAGILACKSVAKAIRAQIKVSVGTNQLAHVRTEDLVEQAFKVSQGITRFQAMLIRWRSPVPPLIPRLEKMIAWAGLPTRHEP